MVGNGKAGSSTRLQANESKNNTRSNHNFQGLELTKKLPSSTDLSNPEKGFIVKAANNSIEKPPVPKLSIQIS